MELTPVSSTENPTGVPHAFHRAELEGARDLSHTGSYPQVGTSRERPAAQAGSVVVMPKDPHTPTTRPRLTAVATTVLAAALALTACSGGNGPATQEPSTRDPAVTDPALEEEQEAALAEAFEERDRFFSEQQAPPGESLAGPATATQQEFIDSQREYTLSKGGEWNEMTEQITLALTFDACENAILSFHQMDAATLGIHIATSPLFGMLVQEYPEDQRETVEASLLSTTLYGMSYICPGDYDQWFDAAVQLYPEYFSG